MRDNDTIDVIAVGPRGGHVAYRAAVARSARSWNLAYTALLPGDRAGEVRRRQTCERKAGFIEQFMRGKVTGRDLDDIGEAVLSYAEVKALVTGNPLVIEQAGIQADLAKLERLVRAHHDEQHRLSRTAASARAKATRRRADAVAQSVGCSWRRRCRR